MPPDRYFDRISKTWLPAIPPELLAESEKPRPGTELKRRLKTLGITAGAGCKCNAKAAEMDREGVEWCEAHFEEIVAVMVEEAEKRGWFLKSLPFKKLGARRLVRQAIKAAKKQSTPATL